MIRDVNARIDVNGVCGKVMARNLVLKEGAVGAEMDPRRVRDAIAGLNAASCHGEVEGSIDICIRVGEGDPTTKWHEVVTGRIILGRVGWLDEISGRFGGGCLDIMNGMVL